MVNISSKKIKELLSKKYLDWAEVSPKFRSDLIHGLKALREYQRVRSSKSLKKRESPSNASLFIKKMRLVFTFQLEDFQKIQHAVKKLFPGNEEVGLFVKELKEKETDLYGLSWHHIGLIVKDRGCYGGSTKFVNDLPKHVKSIHISYHRILPSIASLSFSFSLEDTLSEELKNIQTREYLPSIIFKSILPSPKLLDSYTMGGDSSESATHIMRGHVSDFVCALENWIQKRIPMVWQPNVAKSVIELYELKGNPLNPEEIAIWEEKNKEWLRDYGFSTLDPYKSENLYYCEAKIVGRQRQSHILTAYEKKDNIRNHFLDLKLNSLTVMAAMKSILENLQSLVEKNRSSEFLNLNKFDKKILKNNISINTLKRLVPILKRFQSEITKRECRILHQMDGISELKSTVDGKDYYLMQIIMENIKHIIKTLIQTSNIIDIGLTNYLEVQNIYATYRLQRWIFVLTVVATLATIVSVLSGWKDLSVLWCKIELWYSHTPTAF